MSKIIIQIQGGLVQDIFISGKGVPTDAIVIDEDTDGFSLDDITSVKNIHGDGFDYEAFIHTESIKKLEKNCDVDKIVKVHLKKK